MRLKKTKFRLLNLTGLVLFLIIGLSSSALAQGSIYGSVANSDLSAPANGEITFVGFLDDTDEEIRIETSDGAGFDAGNWFDDFQNYLTEAPGNPYDFYFYNTSNNEGFHLAGAIPSNSFQEENIQLAAVAWPLAPTGLTVTTVSSSSVVLSWTTEPGLTYHIYRRLAASNGSFFRVDNPSGDLADIGVADGYFVDNTVDGASSYSYMLIAQDGSGSYSPRSAIITANAAAVEAPVIDSIVPDHGSNVGGTPVSIYGSGFDMNGVNAVVGTASLTGITVVNPYQINGTTQAGTVGAADVAVTNLSSTLAAPALTGAYTYDANTPPVLAAIGARTLNEGEVLSFTATATDVDGGNPLMTSTALPGTATYVDNGDGTADFNWTTLFTDAGVYNITFYATDDLDPLLVDSEVVVVTVNDAGNQPPVMTAINDTSIVEGGSLFLAVSATDADGEIPTLSASDLPTNATFVDNLDGTGDFNFNPDLTQSGTYNVIFKALDAALDVDSIVVQITVTETNQEPVLTAIGAQAVDENVNLNFTVTATDGDGTTPVLSTSTPLPGTATFTDNLDGTGVFDWTPTFSDQGSYDIMFYAEDGAVPGTIDSELVTITVNDAGNQAPILDSIPDVAMNEGDTLTITVTASDPDSTIPALTVVSLPTNATFGDSADGSGLFTFTPDYTQSGDYTVTFVASDGTLADTQAVLITVTELGNLPPVFDSIGNFAVNENDQLIINVTATDPDGGALLPSLAVSTSLNNYTFVDNGDGTGVLTYDPDLYDAGTDTVTFFATDFGVPQQTAIVTSFVTTNETNQAPVFVAVGAVGAAVDETMELIVTAYDSTDQNTAHRLYLSAVSPPTNSDFVDNGDNTGTFTFTPDSSQIGSVTATFLAVDQGVPQLSTNLVVTINVVVENVPPVIDSIGPQILSEGQTLNLIIESYDPDGGGSAPSLSAKNLPENANFLDQGTGTGLFSFTPSFVQGGASGKSKLYYVEFRAYDGISYSNEIVLFQVNDAGDQAPVFDSVPSPTVTEGENIVITLTGYDPDTMAVTFTVDETTLPAGATFEDLGDGSATITFSPDFTQAGTYDVDITISDGTTDVTVTMTITVNEAGNQSPILTPITSPQVVLEHTDYTLSISASDPDGDSTITLSTSTLPGTATFSSNDNVGSIYWEVGYEDSGTYFVTVYAVDDAFDSVFQDVEIQVQNVNQLPRIQGILPPPINPYAENADEVAFAEASRVYEGDTLLQWIYTYDPDDNSSPPVLNAHLNGLDYLPPNFSFEDFGDGSGLLTMTPDYTQGSPNPGTFYNISFDLYDGDYVDSGWTTSQYQYTVWNYNQQPELSIQGGATTYDINENGNLNFLLFAYDPDRAASGSLPTITVGGLPTNASLASYSTIGDTSVYYFEFNPDYTQGGSYALSFFAVDYLNGTDTIDVTINVLEAGNQTPYFTTVDSVHNIPLSTVYVINLDAVDPDMDSMIISVDQLLTGAVFVDNGDGTCSYSVSSDAFGVDTLNFTVTDYPGGASSTKRVFLAFVTSLRGDLDSNNKYTMNDLVVLIDYLYRDGAAPAVLESADIDKNGELNIVDITYLIKFLYHDGAAPPQ